jgi:hypothetical protein
MQRIAPRALALLICAVMFVGLIGARPLSPQSQAVAPAIGMSAINMLTALAAQGTSSLAKAAPAEQPTATPPPKPRAESFRALSDDIIEAAPPPRAVAPPKPAAKAVPAWIPGNGPWMRGELVAQTERLDLYVGKNTFSAEQIAGRAAKLERVLRAAEDYFGTTLKRRVSIGFYRNPPKRGVRGMAFTDVGRIELYYRPGEDLGRATTIAMHEMGHHLEVQRYGEAAQRRADTILHEGLATWIASIRWLDQCGASSWKQQAIQLRNAGVPMRLLTAERSGADNAYELWASFVDYLVRQYGWKKFDALYASGRGRAPGSARYQEVLGKPLDQLADDWRAWVER